LLATMPISAVPGSIGGAWPRAMKPVTASSPPALQGGSVPGSRSEQGSRSTGVATPFKVSAALVT
jgi:hypothetical protein